jgi:hypothetical protein
MTAEIFLGDLDLDRNELLNAVAQRLATAPVSPISGQIYYDTVDNCLKFWDGTAWQCTKGLLSSVSGTLPITASLVSGVLTIGINAATGSNPGSMSAADFAKLAAATASNTASTIVIRDGSGNASFADPSSAQHAATKNYVDNVAQGLDVKASVRAATTANITLSGAQTIDGVSVIAGDRVLVKDQITPANNGIYVAASGAWARATDNDAWAEVPGAFVFVEEGTVNADSGWVSTANQGGTLNTTPIPWSQFSGAGSITAGAGLTKTGNTIDVVANADSSIVVNADDIQVKRKSGGGVLVDSNGIYVEGYTPVASRTVARKFVSSATTIGSGSAVSFTHNLGTRDVQVTVRDNSSDLKYQCKVVPTAADPTNKVDITANGASKTVVVTIIG